MMAPLFSLMSPTGPAARLSVLIFHRVLPAPDPLFPGEVCAADFDRICGWLASWFCILPLDEAATRLAAGTLPARAACITFDDGYADNHDVALPILVRHGLCATFFIATGFLDGGRMWNDTLIEAVRRSELESLDLDDMGMGIHALSSIAERRTAIDKLIGQIKYRPVSERLEFGTGIAQRAGVQLPANLMMSSTQVIALCKAGMQIGGHTVSHPILATMSDDAALEEMHAGRQILEHLLGAPVRLFAYPNGKFGEDYSPRTVELVRSLGFDAAVSTNWGTSRHGDDPFQIKRFTPWDRTRLRFGARLLANLRG